MFRRLKLNSTVRHILLLVSIPLVLTSTGYALFSQDLTVNGSANVPNYTSSENLSLSYSTSVAAQGQDWNYTVSATINNNGSRDTTAWESTFSLPADYSNTSCLSSSCSTSGATMTITDDGSNGTITAAGTVNYSFMFRSASQTYQFTDLTVSGTLAPLYQPVSGLTVSTSAGTRTQQGQDYIWPYTFTVTNNSGQDLVGWRIIVPWDTSTNSVSSMPGTVNYVENATQLEIYSTQALNDGTNFQFTADLTSTNQNWTMTGETVEGEF